MLEQIIASSLISLSVVSKPKEDYIVWPKAVEVAVVLTMTYGALVHRRRSRIEREDEIRESQIERHNKYLN